jgi:dTDP-4-dehydrorhamnose reductase
VEETKLRILVTGAEGNLGSAIIEELSSVFEVIGTEQSTLDITEAGKIKSSFNNFSPKIIIHTAAQTNVDGCEMNQELAYKVNIEGTRNVVGAAKDIKAMLFYISTDYIFDGENKKPYSEVDKPNPLNVYGKSKLEGEKIVGANLNRYFIIRSSWLFGKKRKTFVEKIIDQAKMIKSINVVDPKIATPTYVKDLAGAITRIIDFYSKNPDKANLFGIYNITNSGFCSWLEYAKKILEYSHIEGVKLNPVTQEQFAVKAKRPVYSVLDNSKYNSVFSYRLRPWQEALKEYICSMN